MAIHADDKCIFCMIVQGTVPSLKVYETDDTLAFLDISPVSVGHTLVIPKYHARTIGDLPAEYLSSIGPVLKKVAFATGAEQYNILQNNGKLAFQRVDHVHFHVIPKTSEKDGMVMNVAENWPIMKVEKEELARTLEAMKGRLNT